MSKLKELENMLEATTRLVDLSREFHDLYSFASIQKWKIGETMVWQDVKLKKISEEGNVIRMVCTMPPNSKVIEHWHDYEEIFEVINGSVYDNNSRAHYFEGQTWVTPKYTKHSPINKGKITAVLLITAIK